MYSINHLLLQIGVPTLGEWVSLHPHDSIQTIGGIDLLVREIVSTGAFKDSVTLKVIASPEMRLNGVFVTRQDTHFKETREKCIDALAQIVLLVYQK